MNDLESMLYVLNREEYKKFRALYWQSVQAESELELVKIDLIKKGRNTDKIDSIIQSFRSMRIEAEQYRTKYTNLIEQKYADRIKYEQTISELTTELEIIKFEEL